MPTIYSGRAARPDDGAHPGTKSAGLSRRALLRGTAATGLGALLVISGRAVICPSQAWGLETQSLKPETMATLIQMARDIYPHDRLVDRYYAIAVKDHDTKAAENETHRDLIEGGIGDLDARAGAGGYRGLGWEEERVAVLRQIEDSPFFQAVRSGLVVSLYNQHEIWPLFGYEGESYSKGGYIHRGFDDIDWL
ncbi:gluconate 2-dehydrogenase subunit 3 family protein [Breoghania sp. JC706]|uniref:gluconate 2-dehydrogenase subunit 3 family protein n=1 Tax=Breoghania sp. JC706 TaxID=3117732 RepID=UPI00300B07E7